MSGTAVPDPADPDLSEALAMAQHVDATEHVEENVTAHDVAREDKEYVALPAEEKGAAGRPATGPQAASCPGDRYQKAPSVHNGVTGTEERDCRKGDLPGQACDRSNAGS